MKRLLSIWRSWPRRRRRLIGWATGCLLAYTLVGFFLVPWIVRLVATSRLTKELDRPVSIRSVRMNPYVLSCAVRGLLIQDKDGEPFVSWGEVYVNFQLSSFFGQPWVFKRVSATNIYVRAQLNKDNRFNFSDLLEKFASKPEPIKPSKPLALRIDQLRISGARAAFTDLTPLTPFRRVIGPLEVTLNDFHTDPNSRNPYSFVGSTDAGESFAWSGLFSLSPIRSSGDVTVRGISIAKYAPLFQDLVRFEIKDGMVSGQSSYQMTVTPKTIAGAVTNTSFRMVNLKVAEKDKPDSLVEVDDFSVQGVSANTVSRVMEVGNVSVSGGRIDVKRAKDATINVVEIANPAPGATNTPGGILMLMRAATNAFAMLIQSTNLWSATVDQVDVTNCSVHWEDLANPRPVQVSVDDISLQAHHLSNVPGSNQTAVLSLRWNTNGSMRIATTASIQPAFAQVDLALSDLELRPLDPYLEPYLNLFIMDSKVGLNGQLNLELATNGLPQVSFRGEARMDDFATIDSLMTEDLVKWKTVHITGLQAELLPPTVAIERIAITDPFALVVVETNRVLNLQQAVKTQPTNATVTPTGPVAAAPEAKSGGMGRRLGNLFRQALASATNSAGAIPAKVTVDSIVISNAFVQFNDRSLHPPVKISVQELNGTIQGVSSEELKRAEIHLVGKADRTGPIEINGRINPLSQKTPTELQVVFHDVDLSPTSPYAGKFLGYRLSRGKLDLQVNYEVSERNLKAKNLVVLNQFTLGEKVESPDATTLPVRLAVALLKDRNGRIEIDVPIEGNLDDPQFHYGKVITHVIVNLITKMVTSPFAVLGALFGGKGEEVSYQDFAPGSAEMLPAGQEKLQGLIHGLQERPGLELQVEGAYDPTADRDALRKQKFENDIRRRKWAALRESEQSKMSADQLPLAPDEYNSYLRVAYNAIVRSEAGSDQPSTTPAKAPPRASRSAKGSNPPSKPSDKGATALVKQPTVESNTAFTEMERAVLETMPVSEDDLKRLALERAKQVRAKIIESIEPERVVLADALSTNQATRVFFHLQ